MLYTVTLSKVSTLLILHLYVGCLGCKLRSCVYTFLVIKQFCLNFHLRNELDLQDTVDKYPEGFSVMLDIVISPKDRAQEKAPWENFTGKGLGPRILFSGKDEMERISSEFGKCNI